MCIDQMLCECKEIKDTKESTSRSAMNYLRRVEKARGNQEARKTAYIYHALNHLQG